MVKRMLSEAELKAMSLEIETSNKEYSLLTPEEAKEERGFWERYFAERE